MRNKSPELDAIRFAANYLVVAIHFMILLGCCHGGREYAFWKWLSQDLAPIAMPTLFFISGYLFYIGAESGCLGKIRRRVGRLVVPYVLWNLIVGLLFVLLCVIGLNKAASADLTSPAQLVSWLSRKTTSLWAAPADMPTWYIRTVFIYSLLSSVLRLFMRGRYWLIRLAALFVGISAFDLYLSTAGHTVDFLYTYPPYSLLCFCAGGTLAVHGINLDRFYGKRRILCAFVGISALIVSTNYSCPHGLSCWMKLFECMILFALAPALLKVYRCMPEFVRSSTFWLYVTHLPIFLLLSAFVPKLPFASISLRLLVGIFTMLAISLGSFTIVRRWLPRVSKALNGQLTI